MGGGSIFHLFLNLFLSTHSLFSHIPQGFVPLKKVKLDAKLEWEFIENFKILQGLFQKKSIDKVIAPCCELGSSLDGKIVFRDLYL